MDVHVTGNTTNGVVSKSSAARLPESNDSSSLSNSVPPCPTNNRTVRVRGGRLMLESTSCRRSPTELLEGMSRPACRMVPLPKASTWTRTSRGASAALSGGCTTGPIALLAASVQLAVPGAAVWAPGAPASSADGSLVRLVGAASLSLSIVCLDTVQPTQWKLVTPRMKPEMQQQLSWRSAPATARASKYQIV